MVGLLMVLRGFLGWMILVSAAQGQWAQANLFSGTAGLNQRQQDFWGRFVYPAALKKGFLGAGMYAEKRFMTDLSYADLGITGDIAKQPVLLRVIHEGNSYFSTSNLSIALNKAINANFAIAIKLGYFHANARGYGGSGEAFAGLGALFKINNKLSWGLQTDGLNSFFSEEEHSVFNLRTGFGYRVSEVASLSVEIVRENNLPVYTLAGFHYEFYDRFYARFGYGFQLSTFSMALGFMYKGIDLLLASSFHLSLGPSTGISISYQFNRGP